MFFDSLTPSLRLDEKFSSAKLIDFCVMTANSRPLAHCKDTEVIKSETFRKSIMIGGFHGGSVQHHNEWISEYIMSDLSLVHGC